MQRKLPIEGIRKNKTRMATRRIIRIMVAGIIKIMLAESHLNSRDLI